MVIANVETASVILTDEHSAYVGLGDVFLAHETVNHGAGEYSRGFASTNGVESVWALLKRAIYGTWHQGQRQAP